MIRLVRVELGRYLRRRAVAALLVLAFVVPAAIFVGTVVNTQPPSADEIAVAEEQVAADRDSRWYERSVERCVENPRRHGIDESASDIRTACEESMGISVDNYLWWQRLSLVSEREEGSGVAVLVVVGILMMLAGTTFVGHEWNTGSLGNHLLFEPRRLRVWLAKAMVVVGVSAAVGLVVLTAYWLGLAAVMSSRDVDLRDGVLLDCLQSAGRGAVVLGGLGLAGLALTMLFRSTVVTLGIVAGVAIAGGMLLAVFGITNAWNPGLALLAVVNDGTTFWADAANGAQVQRTLTLTRGAAYLGAVLAALVAVSLVTFRRRDVG